MSRERMPPEAFTPIVAPTVWNVTSITSGAAPFSAKPVEVFTRLAAAACASRQAWANCSRVRLHVSRMTLTRTPRALATSTTPLMSCWTYAGSPERNLPMFMTMSSSCAPSSTARRASSDLVAGQWPPGGKPTTAATVVALSRSRTTASGTSLGRTQRLPTPRRRHMSAAAATSRSVRFGLSTAWSITRATCWGVYMAEVSGVPAVRFPHKPGAGPFFCRALQPCRTARSEDRDLPPGSPRLFPCISRPPVMLMACPVM